MSSEIIPLVPEKLYALVNTFALSGSTTLYAPAASGYAPATSYLYVEGDHALLAESGFTVHREQLLDQIASVIGPSTTLSVILPRVGEFNSVCNTRAVVERFDVRTAYAAQAKAVSWADFHPGEQGYSHPVDSRQVARHDTVDVHPDGSRRLDAFIPQLRLLPTHWLYDAGTRALFTSDTFTHVWRGDDTGPWVVDATDPHTSVEEMRNHLVATKFWWLIGADTDPIKRDLEDVFQRYEIDTIIPAFGFIISGRDAVEQHYDMLQEVLARTAGEPARVGPPESARLRASHA